MKKILIIKLSALGDVFMALPQVDAILAHHVDDQVWIMTSPPFVPLFANHPRLHVVVLDRSRLFGKHSSLTTTLWVRKKQFNAIYDLQGNRTSRRVVRFSGARRRVGTQPRSVYNYHPEYEYTRTTQLNVFDRLNQTLGAAGLPKAKTKCTLYPALADQKVVADFRRQYGLQTALYVLLHAGSSIDWPSKRWPAENFAALAAMFEKRGLRCVWVGGDEDREINRGLAQKVGIDATSTFSIIQLALLGRDARFAVTNDSGPMHILAAAAIPVYSFFGPTSWIRSHAVGQKERIIQNDRSCSPCFLGKCPPKVGHVCLDPIRPATVFEKIFNELKF